MVLFFEYEYVRRSILWGGMYDLDGGGFWGMFLSYGMYI